jgi:hypothetical protein
MGFSFFAVAVNMVLVYLLHFMSLSFTLSTVAMIVSLFL